jgi:hypothetical protein
MAFNIDNYVDVPTRLTEALKKYPNLRIQETDAQVVTMPDGSCFYRCTVTVYRDVDDALPAIATAAEPYPGKTPYTKNSEFMVGMTSALGRALGYMGFGVNKSIASKNEVLARHDDDSQLMTRPEHTRAVAGSKAVANDQAPSGNFASVKQINFIKALAKGLELDEGGLLLKLHELLGRNDVILETLTASDATKVIGALK